MTHISSVWLKFTTRINWTYLTINSWTSDLVFAPQEAVGLIVDAGANKVHAVVLNSEV